MIQNLLACWESTKQPGCWSPDGRKISRSKTWGYFEDGENMSERKRGRETCERVIVKKIKAIIVWQKNGQSIVATWRFGTVWRFGTTGGFGTGSGTGLGVRAWLTELGDAETREQDGLGDHGTNKVVHGDDQLARHTAFRVHLSAAGSDDADEKVLAGGLHGGGGAVGGHDGLLVGGEEGAPGEPLEGGGERVELVDGDDGVAVEVDDQEGHLGLLCGGALGEHEERAEVGGEGEHGAARGVQGGGEEQVGVVAGDARAAAGGQGVELALLEAGGVLAADAELGGQRHELGARVQRGGGGADGVGGERGRGQVGLLHGLPPAAFGVFGGVGGAGVEEEQELRG